MGLWGFSQKDDEEKKRLQRDKELGLIKQKIKKLEEQLEAALDTEQSIEFLGQTISKLKVYCWGYKMESISGCFLFLFLLHVCPIVAH